MACAKMRCHPTTFKLFLWKSLADESGEVQGIIEIKCPHSAHNHNRIFYDIQ